MRISSSLLVACVAIVAALATVEAARPAPKPIVSLKGKCPCADASLCLPLETPPIRADGEFLMYATNPVVDFSKYNAAVVTTIALFGGLAPEMICWAHARGVRVVGSTDAVPASQLTNKTARAAQIAGVVQTIRESFLDGVNIDFESPLAAGSAEVAALTAYVSELTAAVKALGANRQVTIDLAWSPTNAVNGGNGGGVDGRNYDYASLITIVDASALMFYDEQSQMFTANASGCRAGPNSPLSNLLGGLDAFMSLVPPSLNIQSKLIAGLPWYGYIYTCEGATTITPPPAICRIKSVPFRGVPCSDAAGGQIALTQIARAAAGGYNNTATKIVTDVGRSSFASFYVQQGPEVKWVVYDNAETLAQKISVIGRNGRGLAGVAIWNVDQIYPTDQFWTKEDQDKIWNTFSYF